MVGWRVGLLIGWRVCSLLSALGPCALSSLCQKKSPSSDGSLHNAGTTPPEKAHPHAQVGWLGWLVGCQWVGWLVGRSVVFTTREQSPLRRPIPTLRWVGWVGLVGCQWVGWLVGRSVG